MANDKDEEGCENQQKISNSEQKEKSGFSFGFSKKIEHKVKINSVISSEKDQELLNETDFISSVDKTGISGPKGRKQPSKPIIPLIQSNNWRVNDSKNELDELAINEIIAESKVDASGGYVASKKQQSLAIPLLMKNKPPVGYETDERLDVSLRPNEAEDADYEQMPIKDYGLAMLRGMGWKDGEGIGRDKTVVPTIDAVLRPKGMGLGADKGQLSKDKNGGGKGSSKDDKDKLEMKKGAHCSITKGPHIGLYGEIQGIDEENARVIVKMALSGQAVTLSQFTVNLVTDKEYLGSSRVINKAKVDEYKDNESKISNNKVNDNSHEDSDHSSKHSKHKKRRSRSKSRSRSRSPHKSKKHKSHKHKSKDSKSHSSHRSDKDHHKHNKHDHKKDDTNHDSSVVKTARPWLVPQLRVRIISQDYKGGKYYNAKVVIVDVLTPMCCSCKTDDGILLDDVTQDIVETVIPRSTPAYIRFIAGRHRGQTGEIIQRDKRSATASVQLLSNRDDIVTVSFDDICEYVGDVSEDFDY